MAEAVIIRWRNTAEQVAIKFGRRGDGGDKRSQYRDTATFHSTASHIVWRRFGECVSEWPVFMATFLMDGVQNNGFHICPNSSEKRDSYFVPYN